MRDRGPGGKNRRKGRGSSVRGARELVFAEPGVSVYAYVSENCGNGHYRVSCGDGVDRLGVLRGAMRRRSWVNRGDIVLASTRDFQDGKCDIVHRYYYDDVLSLIQHGEIAGPLRAMYDNGGETSHGTGENDGMIVFENDCGVDVDGI